jgi:pyrroloquinoline quinone biosynthesis protein B
LRKQAVDIQKKPKRYNAGMNLRCAALAALMICAPALGNDAVFIRVLGIAQDAGYPQTSCYRPHCMRAWENPRLRRKASSIAVVDPVARTKYLFDASPDMREQLYDLHRAAPDGDYVLDGVFLTHGHMGHYTGLMHIGREAVGASNIPVYAMPRMHAYLSSNGPWDQLVRLENIDLRSIEDGNVIKLNTRVSVTPFLVPHRDEYTETVGYRIDGPGKSAVFIPDIDKWEMWETDIREVVRSVDYALIDATFFRDGELGDRDMSKIRHPFVAESMDLFESLSKEEKARVIFIHMNHTNPLLIDGSPEQSEVERRGYRFAREGMILEL